MAHNGSMAGVARTGALGSMVWANTSNGTSTKGDLLTLPSSLRFGNTRSDTNFASEERNGDDETRALQGAEGRGYGQILYQGNEKIDSYRRQMPEKETF